MRGSPAGPLWRGFKGTLSPIQSLSPVWAPRPAGFLSFVASPRAVAPAIGVSQAAVPAPLFPDGVVARLYNGSRYEDAPLRRRAVVRLDEPTPEPPEGPDDPRFV